MNMPNEEKMTLINKPSTLEDVLNKYNPVLSARDHRFEYLIDNPESEAFPYTEEYHSYDSDMQ
jgi:hypothetical protein